MNLGFPLGRLYDAFKTHERGRGPDDWMCTASGVKYYPANPRAEDIRVEDIAHHLSRICRYTGAISAEHYSVAEHSVHVSYTVPPPFAYEGLMHDWPEYVLGDFNRPAKHQCPDYMRLEDLNWRVGAAVLGLPLELHPAVKEADARVYLAERLVLMPPLPDHEHYASDLEPAPVKIMALSPNRAKQLFLARYRELTGGLKQTERRGGLRPSPTCMADLVA